MAPPPRKPVAVDHIHRSEDIYGPGVGDTDSLPTAISEAGDADSVVAAHSADTTGVHGIADTSLLQPLDANLTAIAALATTSFGRSFLDRADAGAGRALLGLGSAALSASEAFDASGAAAAAAAASVPESLVTAKGDLPVASGNGAVGKIAAGADYATPRWRAAATNGLEAVKNNVTTTAPGVGNDNTQGYSVGSRWLDTTGQREYVCISASTGAASWVNPSPAGASLSSFRLASMADDPNVVALGANGDELEYTSKAALAAVWTDHNFSVDDYWQITGSGILMRRKDKQRAFTRAITVPTNCEIGILVSGICTVSSGNGFGMMFGPLFVDSSGNGVAAFPYSDGNAYVWPLTAYGQSGSPSSGGAHGIAAYLDGRPFWLLLRKAGTTYSLRQSADDLSTITTLHSGATVAGTMTAIGFGSAWNANGGDGVHQPHVHRFIYGTPTLSV